ncbi:MAG: hypothetical protein ABJA66_04570 [Actinomycetota bacterium]
MKYYLIITGIAFALIVLAHFARVYAEGSFHFTEPIFLFTTILSLALSVWAFILLKRLLRPSA